MAGDDTLGLLRSIATSMSAKAPRSGALLWNLLADVERRGPVRTLVKVHPNANQPLFYIKVFAALGYLYESGLAPEFRAHLAEENRYAELSAFDQRSWDLACDALLANAGIVHSVLATPVQQHHPSRAGVLLQGLGLIGAPSVRLLELGACAGLNLLFDRYWWLGNGWSWGDPNSPVRLAAPGNRPAAFQIVERAGCDLSPRDPADPDDVMILRSYFGYDWDIERLEFDEAIALAAIAPARVDEEDAVTWLQKQLGSTAGKSVTTVVWHSMFWNFLDEKTQTTIEHVLAKASRRMNLVRIGYEPHRICTPPRLQMTVYS